MDIGLDVAGEFKGDLTITNGDLVILEGLDAIRQHVDVRLKFLLGENFLDTREGIPYFERVLGKITSLTAVSEIFRSAILNTPGVINLNNFRFDFDGVTRKLFIDFTAQTTEGSLDFSEAYIVPKPRGT